MPRTCLACASPNRQAIDKALVSGEPLRNIAKRVSISAAGLLRHKHHVATAIEKAQARQEEKSGETLLGAMQRVQRKAWELLEHMEQEGDNRGAVVALREARECVESLGEMIYSAGGHAGVAWGVGGIPPGTDFFRKQVTVQVEHIGARQAMPAAAEEEPIPEIALPIAAQVLPAIPEVLPSSECAASISDPLAGKVGMSFVFPRQKHWRRRG